MPRKTVNIITVVLIVVVIAELAWAARVNCARRGGDWIYVSLGWMPTYACTQ